MLVRDAELSVRGGVIRAPLHGCFRRLDLRLDSLDDDRLRAHDKRDPKQHDDTATRQDARGPRAKLASGARAMFEKFVLDFTFGQI